MLRLMGLNSGARQGLLPEIPVGDAIPRTIHQACRSKTLSPVLRENERRLAELNPGWRLHLYDNADQAEFIRSAYGADVLSYFRRISPRYGAARADLFRYLLLYKHGGAYLDIKSSAADPLDDIILENDRFILSHWPAEGGRLSTWGRHKDLEKVGGREFQQWHIIAAPGHPFLRCVIERVFCNIDRYLSGLHSTGAYGVWRLTGPIAYTLAIASIRSQHPHRLVADHRTLGLDYSIFDNLDRHKSVQGLHYTRLRSPIVPARGMKRALSIGLLAGRRAARAALRRA